MENVSKALIIAAGILIAIIIITAFMIMYSRITSIKRTQEEKTKMEQLAAFNAQYEAYHKTIMYGADVVTLKNKVDQNNKDNENNPDYKIEIVLPSGIADINFTDNEEVKEILKHRFKCTKMEYNALGRVNYIKIENQ